LLLEKPITSQREDTGMERNSSGPALDEGGNGSEPGRLRFGEDLPTALARMEKEMVVVALRASRGNKARAARALGISERLMGLRVKKYKINPRSFRTNK